MNKKAKHFWNTLEDGDITNWTLIQIYKGTNYCCCGTPIKNIFVLQNEKTKQTKLIGKDCAAKLGIKLKWKTTADYLANAYLMATNQQEKDFVRQQQNRLPTWKEATCFSVKQVAWLEKITNQKFKGKVWKVKA
jgi:hypothetical protein